MYKHWIYKWAAVFIPCLSTLAVAVELAHDPTRPAPLSTVTTPDLNSDSTTPSDGVLRLYQIISRNDNKKAAIINNVMVKAGDTINSILVSEINDYSVKLIQNGQEIILPLFSSSNSNKKKIQAKELMQEVQEVQDKRLTPKEGGG